MRNLSGKMAWLAVIIIVGGLGLLSSGAAADTFVSYNGKFHFSYPEAWVQVDYTTAEYYLTHGNPENQVDFEAVFSEKQSFVIFQGQYMILTVDTLGPMSAEAVDSVAPSELVQASAPPPSAESGLPRPKLRIPTSPRPILL